VQLRRVILPCERASNALFGAMSTSRPACDGTALKATVLRRDAIGIVFQQPKLLSSLTAREGTKEEGRLERPCTNLHYATQQGLCDEVTSIRS